MQDEQQKTTTDEPAISLVIPLLDEAESLPELIARLRKQLDELFNGSFELIFIDDGSTDNSYEVLRSYQADDARIRIVRFRRNYGKSAALSVGFERVRAPLVVTMDADLQDDPDEIPRMYEKLEEGYDLVSGWKKKRHDPWHKTIPSRLFNTVTSRASGIKLHDFNCGFKIYRRAVVKELKVYGEMHRYLPALAHWHGFRVTELPVRHHPRRFGVSKFGLSRLVKGYLDLMTVLVTTRYLKRPLHLFGSVGSIFGLAGFGINLYLSIQWFLGNTYFSNRPVALLGVVLIIVGIQLVSMGLISELMVRNSINNDQYSIREEL